MPKTLVPFQVFESVCGAPGRVDREAGIIHGVKILGKTSLNGREYSDAALQDAAQRYAGMRVNIDHPEKQAIKSARGTMEQWGWLESIEVRDDGVFGDLHFLKTHPHTEPLLELAERRPDKFGLSHNADCSGYLNGRKQVIESVDKVRSVDVVQKPATTQGLFEHEEEQGDDMPKKTFRAILESAPENLKGRSQLLKLLEMDGMADMGAMPVEVPAEATAEDQVWAGFRGAIIGILDDDSLDIATTRDQIMKVLDSYSSAFETGATGGEAEAEGATTEGVDELRREVRLLRAEGKARDVLEHHDIQATPGRIKGIISVLESASDLQDLIGSFPKRSAQSSQSAGGNKTEQRRQSQKPVRSAPLVESEQEGGQSALPYKDFKEMARLIR